MEVTKMEKKRIGIEMIEGVTVFVDKIENTTNFLGEPTCYCWSQNVIVFSFNPTTHPLKFYLSGGTANYFTLTKKEIK
jgi:hypothetical protein